MKACDKAHKINKLVEDDNLVYQIQKGAVEQQLDKIAFVTERINDAKEEHRRSIRISVVIISVLHCDMAINNLIRCFIDFYFTTSELIALTKLKINHKRLVKMI